MDIYTKYFLANMVAMIFTMAFDRNFLCDALEKMKYVGSLMGLWGITSILSIPVWIIYLIASA
jgi:hypothetical protein